MHPGAALVIFVLAVAPLVCAVDFSFHRRTARYKPSFGWLGGLLAPFVLLVVAAATHVPVLSVVALVLSAAMTVAWIARRRMRKR